HEKIKVHPQAQPRADRKFLIKAFHLKVRAWPGRIFPKCPCISNIHKDSPIKVTKKLLPVFKHRLEKYFPSLLKSIVKGSVLIFFRTKRSRAQTAGLPRAYAGAAAGKETFFIRETPAAAAIRFGQPQVQPVGKGAPLA